MRTKTTVKVDLALLVNSLSTYDLGTLKELVDAKHKEKAALDEEKVTFLFNCILKLWPNDEILTIKVAKFRCLTFIPCVKAIKDKFGFSLKISKEIVDEFFYLIGASYAYEGTISFSQFVQRARK